MKNSDEKEKIVKEFTEEELEILNKISEGYSEKITLIVQKEPNGELYCNVTFSGQSPQEIATFLYTLDKIGIRPLVNLALLSVKDRDETSFSRIAKGYLNKIDRADQREIDKPILRPSQVLTVHNGQ